MNNFKRIISAILILSVVLCLAACVENPGTTGSTKDPGTSKNQEVVQTVTVKTNGCALPQRVTVYVYDSVERNELIKFGPLDENGQFIFTDLPGDEYIAVLDGIKQEGYGLQEYYPLTGTETEIVLNGGVVKDKNPLEQNKVYYVGDFMRDFTVTTSDGVEMTLSEILEEKKAVMLNFWYTNCGPCKTEFPHIQKAYEEFREDIEIIAMNSYGESNNAIANFKNNMGLTFPMAAVSEEWNRVIALSAYPTTLIIDRYGRICLRLNGIGDVGEGVFESIFAYFTADDYEQKILNSVQDLLQ